MSNGESRSGAANVASGKGKAMSAWKNNLYALKLGFQISKGRVSHSLLSWGIKNFLWVFFSGFFLKHIVNALEQGQIAEQGTHEELLKLNGKYAAMWRAQAGQYIEV